MRVVNIELMKLFQWFCANKLSLNLNKTNFILFGKAHKDCLCTDFKVTIIKTIIERVSTTKLLGEYIDEDLNWKYHASEISLKISRIRGILNRAVRIITCSYYRNHSTPLFAHLHVLKLCDIYKLQVLLYMFKAKYNWLPPTCCSHVHLSCYLPTT